MTSVRMAGFSSRAAENDRGIAALEFAIIAPLLFLLVFGILRVGYALGVQHSLTQLAASAAREALPASGEQKRADIVQHYVENHAADYALLRSNAVDCVIREADNALSVTVRMDVSDVPDIPIVSAVYRFPPRQSASAAISVQN